MGFKEKIESRIKLSEEELSRSEDMYVRGYYYFSLFMGRSALEIILKAKCLSDNKIRPSGTNDLFSLAKQTTLELNEELETFLNKLSILYFEPPIKYFIEFDDNKKLTAINFEQPFKSLKEVNDELYTKEFTYDKLVRIKSLLNWIKEQIPAYN